MFHRNTLLYPLLAVSFLGACNNGGGGSGGGAASDSAAPTVTIDFPPAGSVTDAPTVNVRGRANDASSIASIRVNGVLALTFDGFANWWAQIPVGTGDVPIVVASADTNSNSNANAATSFIHSDGPLLFDVRDVELDATHGRALVVDAYQRALIGVDLDSSARFLISGLDAALGQPFSAPSAVVLSPDGTSAWVADALANTIFRVDLATGTRVIVSSPGVGTGPALSAPQSMAYDTPFAELIVASGTPANTLIAVDPVSGNRTVLSSPSVGTGTPFESIRDIEAGGPHGSLLVTDGSLQRVVSVSTSNGNRTRFSGAGTGSGPVFTLPTRCARDNAGHRLLVADDAAGSVFAVDLMDGARTIVATNGVGTGPELGNFRGLVWNPTGAKLLVAQPDRLIRVNLTSGDRELWTTTTRGSGNAFEAPTEITYETDTDGLYVVDSPGPSSTLMAVRPATGDREIITVLAGTGTVGAHGLEITRGHSHVLTLGNSSVAGDSAILGFKITDFAARSIGPLDLDPATVVDMSAEIGGSRMLVARDSALYSVELGTQSISVIADAATGSGPLLTGLVRVAAGTNGIEAFATQSSGADSSPTGLVGITLANGQRRVVSSDSVGSGPVLQDPAGLALDGSGTGAYVIDRAENALFRIDLATGARSIVTQSPTVPGTGLGGTSTSTGAGPSFASPIDVTLDRVRLVAYTTHRFPVRGVLAVDLVSGDRVLVSR